MTSPVEDPEEYSVYLAGAIFGMTDEQCKEWRDYLERIPGFKWLNPMRRDMRGSEDVAWEHFTDLDLRDVEASDAIVVNGNIPGWGTGSELVWAWLLRTPVVTFCNGPVSPWLRKWSTKVVSTKEEVLEALKEALDDAEREEPSADETGLSALSSKVLGARKEVEREKQGARKGGGKKMEKRTRKPAQNREPRDRQDAQTIGNACPQEKGGEAEAGDSLRLAV